MIQGIGIDIIELDRMKRSLDKNEKILQRVLTKAERDCFSSLRSERRKLEFLAGRFAAKEAFAKATGRGIGKLSFQDIQILPLEHGAPRLEAKGYQKEKIWVSISHSQAYAVAQVIIEA